MTIRVFVNAQGLDAPAGATALDAVRQWSTEAAHDVEGGTRLITDSRGLPIDPSTTLAGGAILRLVAKRDRTTDESAVEPGESDASAPGESDASAPVE
jgi:hypothetical protein